MALLTFGGHRRLHLLLWRKVRGPIRLVVWRIDEIIPGEFVMLTAVEASREVSDKTTDSSNDVFAGKSESVVFVTALPGLSKK